MRPRLPRWPPDVSYPLREPGQSLCQTCGGAPTTGLTVTESSFCAGGRDFWGRNFHFLPGRLRARAGGVREDAVESVAQRSARLRSTTRMPAADEDGHVVSATARPAAGLEARGSEPRIRLVRADHDREAELLEHAAARQMAPRTARGPRRSSSRPRTRGGSGGMPAAVTEIVHTHSARRSRQTLVGRNPSGAMRRPKSTARNGKELRQS